MTFLPLSNTCINFLSFMFLGSDVVLGHVTGGRSPILSEQKIVRLKHSPGSGVLSVAVVSDGPTRILRITDENKKVS